MALQQVVPQIRQPAHWFPAWRPGIRARLFLLALITLSPLVGVLIFQDYYHLVAARQRAEAETVRLAQIKASDVDQYLLALETQLVGLRSVVVADPAQIPANDATLAAIIHDLPAYVDGIGGFTQSGRLLGGAWRDDLGRAIPPSTLEDQVLDTQADRRLVVGQPLALAPTRPTTVLVSRAIADRTGLVVVLVMALRPDRMPLLADVRGLPRGSTVTIVDVRGPILARSASSPPTEESDRRPVGSDVRMVGHAVADRAPWVVYADTPIEVALLGARADFYRDIILGVIMLVLAMLLAWLIAERITAPIRQLTADAAALGAGHLSRRTAVKSGGEIGVLVNAFNEAAAEIEQLVGDLRLTQNELKSLNTHLEQRVRDRTAQLAALNSELEAFSFSVSHDLRAPLRRIDRFGAALLEDYGERLDEDGRMMLQRLSAGCEQMNALIEDLLRLSQVSRAELFYRPVDLSALARDIVAELRAGDPSHPAQVDLEENLVVYGDMSLLRVVLQNLLSNAWKFTHGVSEPRIKLGSADRDGARAFYVEDNGAGFDAAHAEKLFRPFQRLHDSREFEGTGVGLATVQRVIHRHGGRVWADGAVGAGATFWVTVPDQLDGR